MLRVSGRLARTAPAGLLAVSLAACAAEPPGEPTPEDSPPSPVAGSDSRLLARSVLPAATLRPGSPPAGAFLSAAERATAAANGIPGASTGPYFATQPVQGFSSMVPAAEGGWWALADNGFAWRHNSADWQLVLYRIDPRWGDPAGPALLATVPLRDPDRRIDWRILCDPASGAPLPALAANAPPPPPPACGEPALRQLTGFDLDPESLVRAPDGSLWIGDEFGPFLLHVAADGRLLEPPVEVPGVRSPQSPRLDLSDPQAPERPTVAASRGFEGLGISPDGERLFALLEGAVAGDDPSVLRVVRYRIASRRFEHPLRYRLDEPSQTVDLAALGRADGTPLYPDASPPAPGAHSIGELKALDDRRFLVIERDNLGDDERPPQVKRLYLAELPEGRPEERRLGKTLLLDLLALPDPEGISGERGTFGLPFYTIESVHPVDERTLLVASDNNFPLSSGRARSETADRLGPLVADATELVLVRLAAPLAVDPRLLPAHPESVP